MLSQAAIDTKHQLSPQFLRTFVLRNLTDTVTAFARRQVPPLAVSSFHRPQLGGREMVGVVGHVRVEPRVKNFERTRDRTRKSHGQRQRFRCSGVAPLPGAPG
eukprot:Amastigsp_a680110_28.p5 type:complete len:103 gc:universal Amastigsp_a680110_28:238-546(+)